MKRVDQPGLAGEELEGQRGHVSGCGVELRDIRRQLVLASPEDTRSSSSSGHRGGDRFLCAKLQGSCLPRSLSN